MCLLTGRSQIVRTRMWTNAFIYGRDMYHRLYEQGYKFAVYPCFWFDAGWCDETKSLFGLWGHLGFSDFFNAPNSSWFDSSTTTDARRDIHAKEHNFSSDSKLLHKEPSSKEPSSYKRKDRHRENSLPSVGTVKSITEDDVSAQDLETLQSVGWPHAFAYHWHNQWNAMVDDKSPFAVLERVMYARIRMRVPGQR